MKNAMAVILGANLGTTRCIVGWSPRLGFKANIEIIAYPAVCIGRPIPLFFMGIVK